MNANDFTKEDREILLDAFRKFCANTKGGEGDDALRDVLKEKVQSGGELDEDDRLMLLTGVANEVPDQEVFNHFNAVLEYPLGK